MLRANQQHPGALVIGQRKGLDEMERSKGSKFANAFSNFWFAVQTGHRLGDTQSGFRLYPLKKLHGLSMLTSRYEAELELLVFSCWHGTKIVSTPVSVYYPPKGERVSHFRPIRDFSRIFLLNTLLCVLALVYGLPLAIWRKLMTFLRTSYALLFFLFTVAIFSSLLPRLFLVFIGTIIFISLLLRSLAATTKPAVASIETSRVEFWFQELGSMEICKLGI